MGGGGGEKARTQRRQKVEEGTKGETESTRRCAEVRTSTLNYCRGRVAPWQASGVASQGKALCGSAASGEPSHEAKMVTMVVHKEAKSWVYHGDDGSNNITMTKAIVGMFIINSDRPKIKWANERKFYSQNTVKVILISSSFYSKALMMMVYE